MFLGACTIGEPLLILSEHMRGGNLEDYLIKNRKNPGQPWRPPLKLVARWSTELTRAICFLHNCTPIVIHRDLKPANLLLNEDGHLKVGDFGLCKVKRGVEKVEGTYMMTGKTGSMRYMAPEVFHDDPNYDEKVDIYSMAIIYWYMAMGERPFDRVPANVVAQQAAGANLRPSLDALTARTGDEFARLVAMAWSGDPAQRPTAGELVDMLEAWGQQLPQEKDKKGKNCTIM
jgi:serine/threonine protein kinase